MNRKPIFDAVRKMLGHGFSQAQVDQLDEACDQAEGALTAAKKAPANPASSAGGRTLGEAGLKLIQSFEGCEKDLPDGTYTAYPDPGSADGNPWTIGWGATGPGIKKGTVWTQKQCDDRFREDMQRYADQVSRAIGTAPTTQNQFDALVSFHYNTGSIGTAGLTRRHKEGKFTAAKAEFGKWIYNNHKVMKGLVRRRAAEAELYAKP